MLAYFVCIRVHQERGVLRHYTRVRIRAKPAARESETTLGGYTRLYSAHRRDHGNRTYPIARAGGPQKGINEHRARMCSAHQDQRARLPT